MLNYFLHLQKTFAMQHVTYNAQPARWKFRSRACKIQPRESMRGLTPFSHWKIDVLLRFLYYETRKCANELEYGNRELDAVV